MFSWIKDKIINPIVHWFADLFGQTLPPSPFEDCDPIVRERLSYKYQKKLMEIGYPPDIKKHLTEYAKMQRRLYKNEANIGDRAFMKRFEFLNKILSAYYDKNKGWVAPSGCGVNPYFDTLEKLKEDKLLYIDNQKFDEVYKESLNSSFEPKKIHARDIRDRVLMRQRKNPHSLFSKLPLDVMNIIKGETHKAEKRDEDKMLRPK